MRRSSIISRVHPVRLGLIAMAGLALPLLLSGMRSSRRLGDAQGSAVPRTPEQIAAAARARGLRVPAECAEGVAANLKLLAGHAERMRGNAA